MASLTVRFAVEEAFKGNVRKYVDLSQYPHAIDFETGKRYFVFADPCAWKSDKACLTSYPCSGTRLLADAQAVIEQLRAEKSGRQVASVFGMLFSTERKDRQALPHVKVRLRRGAKSFETTTDDQGVYAFPQLAKGEYEASADLPPGLEIAESYGLEPVQRFVLPSNSSFEYDLYAIPTGRITGKVIGPDGQLLHTTSVYLYRVDQYKGEDPSTYAYLGTEPPLSLSNPFEFKHLAPGDYILIFDYRNQLDAVSGFHRTYYPNAAGFEEAEVIHLARGQQVVDADIHVGTPRH